MFTLKILLKKEFDRETCKKTRYIKKRNKGITGAVTREIQFDISGKEKQNASN